MSGLQRGIAVPNFAEDPAGLIELGVAAERAGFDGFFLWDHIVFSNTGDGPPLADPWLVLAVIASRTSRIRLGTMITPVPRASCQGRRRGTGVIMVPSLMLVVRVAITASTSHGSAIGGPSPVLENTM